MTNVLYRRDLNRYVFPADNYIVDDSSVYFKFDTGADHSIINVSSLFSSDYLAERVVLYVKELTEKKIGIPGAFRSVSGDFTDGILCYVPDFKFNEEIFPFYFYLITSTAYKKALIGVDFISCCDFSCESGKDIIIEKFHNSRYIGALSFQEKEKAINMNDLLEEIQTPAIITRHRIIKEYFGTTTLADFIERVNEPNALDPLDFESSEGSEEVPVNEVDLSDSELATIKAFL